jgi:hypothetical protein
MLREAIDRIKELVEQAHGADVVKVAGEPAHVFYLRDRATGTLTKCVCAADPRSLEALSVEGFAELVGAAGAPVGATKEVFVGREEVVAVFDGPTPRRERCTLQLPVTPQYDRLAELAATPAPDDEEAKPRQFNQRDFLRLLRVELDGCLDPDQINVFRALKLSKSQGGESAIAAWNETFRRSMQIDALAGGMAPPEELTLNVQVYRDMRERAERQEVRCAVDVDLSEATFRLTPLPGELEAAQWRVLQSICQRLRELLPQIPVHEGTTN